MPFSICFIFNQSSESTIPTGYKYALVLCIESNQPDSVFICFNLIITQRGLTLSLVYCSSHEQQQDIKQDLYIITVHPDKLLLQSFLRLERGRIHKTNLSRFSKATYNFFQIIEVLVLNENKVVPLKLRRKNYIKTVNTNESKRNDSLKMNQKTRLKKN